MEDDAVSHFGKLVAAAIAAASVSGAAQATTVIKTETYTPPATGYATNKSKDSGDFSSSKTTPVKFDIKLAGFKTLDGQNFYEDDFTVTLVDQTGPAPDQVLLFGTFNLGGGGKNVVYSGTGITFTGADPLPGHIGGAGGNVDISIAPAISLIAGDTYNLRYSYTSLPGPGHAGFQTTGDEGWGVTALSVTAVPEPATWAMMLIGFGGLGAALRMNRRRTFATA